jgi:hypothetical protein
MCARIASGRIPAIAESAASPAGEANVLIAKSAHAASALTNPIIPAQFMPPIFPFGRFTQLSRLPDSLAARAPHYTTAPSCLPHSQLVTFAATLILSPTSPSPEPSRNPAPRHFKPGKLALFLPDSLLRIGRLMARELPFHRTSLCDEISLRFIHRR